MTHKLLVFFFGAFIALASILIAEPAYGQCGVYFKPDYRAVGKVNPIGSSAWVLSDWNGDGRLDFWNYRLNATTGFRDIVIYPGLATGYWNWDAPIVYTGTNTQLSSGAVASWVVDADGDGRKDVLARGVGAFGSRKIQIVRNVGDGTIQAMAETLEGETLATFVNTIGFLDINSDGRLDWLYTLEDDDTGTETLQYALQDTNGAFGNRTTIFVHSSDNELNRSFRMVADFDGDGKVDIAYRSFSSPARVRVLKNLGNTTFTLGPPVTMEGTNSIIDIRDFNVDGRADFLSEGPGQFRVYFGESNGTVSLGPLQQANNYPNSPALKTGDFNGDSRPDVINFASGTGPTNPSGDYEVFLTNPAGGFTRTVYTRPVVKNPFPLVISDFSGDGKADFYDVSHETKTYFNDEVVTISTNVCSPVGQTKALDFDGIAGYDTNTVWNGATGDWSHGGWTFNWGIASLGDIPSPGDFDGDGKTDVTVFRNSDGYWYIFMSATNSWYVFRFGLPGDIPVPNDYDGGGRSDIAVFRPSDGNWYIWHSETQSFSALHWGANGDRPVPADYDGDRKTDIAVFRPSTGDWYYVKSSDLSYGIIHWGTSGDVPIPADYDGDGRADITVFRSGTWYMLRSMTSEMHVLNWGTTGDIPVAFPERGDSAFPVVFRPSNSRWYLFHKQFLVVVSPPGDPVLFGLPND